MYLIAFLAFFFVVRRGLLAYRDDVVSEYRRWSAKFMPASVNVPKPSGATPGKKPTAAAPKPRRKEGPGFLVKAAAATGAGTAATGIATGRAVRNARANWREGWPKGKEWARKKLTPPEAKPEPTSPDVTVKPAPGPEAAWRGPIAPTVDLTKPIRPPQDDDEGDGSQDLAAGRPCAWKPRDDSDQRCGNPTIAGSPYCAGHAIPRTRKPNTTTPTTGGTMTEAVNLGALIAACEEQVNEAVAEMEAAQADVERAGKTMDEAQANAKLAEENATRIEGMAAYMTEKAPRDLVDGMSSLLESAAMQKQAADAQKQAADAQQGAAEECLKAATARKEAAQDLLDKARQYQALADMVDSLGGPEQLGALEFHTNS